MINCIQLEYHCRLVASDTTIVVRGLMMIIQVHAAYNECPKCFPDRVVASTDDID